MLSRGYGARRSGLPALLGAAAAMLALAPAAAGAESKEKEVPVTMDWRMGNGSPFQCYSYGLATWSEQEDAIGWVLHYKWNGDPRTKTLSPPFDDETLNKEPYFATPGKGKHWDLLSRFSSSHANPNWPPPDCSDGQAKQRAAFSDVKLVVTLAENARISGKVKDPSGDPASGVRVNAKGAGSDRTDSDGEYSIDVPETKKTYKVVPKKGKAKFKPKSKRVRVRPGKTSKANFRIKGKPQVVGTVRMGCEGAESCSVLPVKGVKVTAKKVGGGGRFKARTGESGRFEIDVKRGRYRVSASSRTLSFKPGTRRVKVKSNAVVVDFAACAAGGAAASGIPTGLWVGRDADPCENEVEVRQDGSGAVQVTWKGVPTCAGVNNSHKLDTIVVRRRTVPATFDGTGSKLSFLLDEGFMAQQNGKQVRAGISGYLTSEGGGLVGGNLAAGKSGGLNCWISGGRIPLRQVG